MIPTELLAPLAALGFQGTVIALLVWALVKKDNQVEKLQEARVLDQKERAADNLRSASVIEQLNSAARAREEANDSRWRVMETIGSAVHATVKAVETQSEEISRVSRVIDKSALLIEQIERKG